MNEVLLAQFFVQIPHSSRGDSYQVGTCAYHCIPSLIPTGHSSRSFSQVIPAAAYDSNNQKVLLPTRKQNKSPYLI